MKEIDYMQYEYWVICDPNDPEIGMSNMGRMGRLYCTGDPENSLEREIFEPRVDDKGYLYVTIGFGRYSKWYIHRYVAALFVQNPKWRKGVCHKDGDKTNNTPYNLEWVKEHEECNSSKQPRRCLTCKMKD